jgi:chromosome segregation ATPase
MNLENLKNKIEQAKGKLETLNATKKQALKTHGNLSEKKVALEEAQAFLQQIAQQTQNKIKIHIEDIVQLAIDTCFPDRYIFLVEFEIKRGKTEAKLVFLDDDQEVSPMDDSGGGVVDLAAFGLRIAAWTLSKTDNVIILDEPFRFIDETLQPDAARLLREVSKTVGLQFIIITHRNEIADEADRAYKIELKREGKYLVSEATQIL